MAKPTPERIHQILMGMDWSGHVELPTADLSWLARELATRLNSRFEICDSCGSAKTFLVPTGAGGLCEDCVDAARQDLNAIRFALED